MKLWIVEDKILIDAPSTDDRLMEIPGYGWQPTPRAWEFPNHDGVIALARRILGPDDSIRRGGRQEVSIRAVFGLCGAVSREDEADEEDEERDSRQLQFHPDILCGRPGSFFLKPRLPRKERRGPQAIVTS